MQTMNKLSKAVAGKSKVDDDVLDNLEEIPDFDNCSPLEANRE